MKYYFDILLNNFLLDKSQLVDSTKEYYIKFVKELPQYLYRYFDESKYLIKASVGAGQKSEIPWLCIYNRNVTISATQGIYICYLFKSDMSGFYLVLGQGITTFDELYGSEKYTNIRKVAKYFKELINNENFSKEPIDLNGEKNLSKGYEAGTIISKYYTTDKYDENQLLKDLSDLKEIYDGICDNLIEESYMDIVRNVVSYMEPSFIIADEANKIIEEAILNEINGQEAEIVSLELVDIPKTKRKNKYSKITKKTIKKIDYLKKAKTNAKNGLLGEELVMAYEINRLSELGRQDLAENIKWISKEDDGTGYDIISYDVDDNNNISEKFIEVKTTEAADTNVFFISINELSVMEKLKKQYYIYRVFNLKSSTPELYILNYDDFKNKVELSVENYIANVVNE